MMASSRSRASRARRIGPTGSRSMTSANGIMLSQNEAITSVSARPTSRACDSTSTSKSVLPAIDRVTRIISCDTSSVVLSRHCRRSSSA